jgi:hypothetical protein
MFENNLIAGVSGQGGGYSIEDSLRFNDNDSAYLSRTPATAGNRKTWTWSGWVKRGNITTGANQTLFSANNSSDYGLYGVYLWFTTTDTLGIAMNSGTYYVQTSAVFRDVGGWYHVVVNIDTTQATSSNRVKIYINGEQQTSFATATYPTQNLDLSVNLNQQHTIGARRYTSIDNYFDGYMAEINFIDGQALAPDDFGEINEDTGEWSPKRYAGTYGTNGFYLPFDSNANDDSGNGNNWTENNLASTDYMIDTPTNNFSVLNPLKRNVLTFSEGNLKASGPATYTKSATCSMTMPVNSGKYYWEQVFTRTSSTDGGVFVGIASTEFNPGEATGSPSVYPGQTSDSWGVNGNDGSKNNNATSVSYGSSFASGDIIMVAYDSDNGSFFVGKNGTWFNSGDPSANTNYAYTGISIEVLPVIALAYDSGSSIGNINFGADSSFAGLKTRQGNTDANGIGDFYYAPPAGGYLALCTDNLPEPAIVQPETQFNVVLYTGDGTDDKAITGVGFQPDMVWIKSRSNAFSHNIYDSVRGVSKRIQPNLTNAESSPISGVKSFDADGFTLGNDTDDTNFTSGVTYVAWCWKAGGTAVSNTDGSITSQVSANVDAGFSIATFTAPATSSTAFTIGHGLADAPEMIITKERDGTLSWLVYHDKLPTPKDNYLLLNTTDENSGTVADCWGTSAPTASVFGMKTTVSVNTSKSVVAYCFHSVEGFSKFGSYVGNGSTNGPFVYTGTGFKPAFVMIKVVDVAGGHWVIHDSARDEYNESQKWLFPSSSSAEQTATYSKLDFLSNGFKIRSAPPDNVNYLGGTFIYMAFAEHPFKYATGR